MKTRIFWVPIVVLILVAAGYYVHRQWVMPAKRPAGGSLKESAERAFTPPPALPPPVVQPPVVATRPVTLPPPPQRLAPEMVLPIQDQATIDFSIGSPVIKRGGADDEAMRRALKEMEEATKNLSIPPPEKEPAPRN